MYVKLFASILDSSIWSEEPATRLTWIAMLAMADKEGHVRASTAGLSRRANVGAGECRKALQILSSPDADSGSPEYEGRRIEKVDGGWNLLNYAKYREIRTEEQLKSAARQRKFYHKQRQTSRPSRIDTEAEADTEAKKKKTLAPAARGLDGTAGFDLAPFLDAWKAMFDAYPASPGHLGKLLKPLASNGGHAKTLKRWQHFMAGLRAQGRYTGNLAPQFQKFASMPATYDDPDWFLSDTDRRNMEGL